tara:strand:+ start:261 stop:836 length:576 start_codon:yes stop_codon:yes gene_type:complete
MNLIKINLNQTVSKAQHEEIKEEQQRWLLFGFIVLLILASLSWFYMINRKLNYVIEQRETTIQDIATKTKELTSKGKINLSKIDIKNLYKLEDKRIYWSDKFLELSKMTPEDMAVTKFEFKGKSFNLEGIGNLLEGERPLEVTSDFMNMIEKNETFNKDFKNLKVWKVAKKEYGKNDQEIIEFRIEAKLIK